MTYRRTPRLVLAMLGVLALVSAILLFVTPTPKAVAADGANFDAGMIIDDATFYAAGAMNSGQIQAFLDDKGRACSANALPCVKDIVLTYGGRAGDSYCQALPAGNGVRAAELFAAVAVACNVNPQVLLVLVEKEQSLVSRSNPSDYSYRYATGFGCPDTAVCDETSAGFAAQVYYAAKQFQRYRINPGNYNYQAGRNNNILYNPNTGCGSSSVFIRNQATAGLYNYTPYQPNAAALANLYGTGDGCSSYGNRNFWRMFSDWFGTSTNLLTNASFESGVNSWGFVNGPLDRQLSRDPNGAKSGANYLVMYAAQKFLSLSQDVSTNIQLRQSYTASIWVKSGSPGKPYTGTLSLWGLGGSTEASQAHFTVGDEWTEVTTTLTIAQSGHNVIRTEIYLRSTDALLYLDNTSLVRGISEAPKAALTLQSPSFENGIANWTFKNGFANRQIYNFAGVAQDGQWFLAANTDTPGRSVGQDIPVSAGKGESYTATIWLRSGAGTFSGALALWGMGSGNEAAVAPFTVGTTWTPVNATLTVGQASISNLRLEVYMGSTTSDLYFDNASVIPTLTANPSFERNADGWNAGLTPGVVSAQLATPEVPAPDGQVVGVTSASFESGSIATDVKRRTAVGETYTATLWLRAATAGDTWEGTLALWALGGATELAALPVSISDTWTQVSISLPIAQQSHDTLRIELYTNSPGEVLYLDGVMLR